MRGWFDQECFGWVCVDPLDLKGPRTFEPLPMPLHWRDNYQAAQILQSRAEHRHGNADPLFEADAHYPNHGEISAVCAEFMRRASVSASACNERRGNESTT